MADSRIPCARNESHKARVSGSGPTLALSEGWLRIQEWLAGLGVDVSQIQDALASLGSNAGGALSSVVTATVTQTQGVE